MILVKNHTRSNLTLACECINGTHLDIHTPAKLNILFYQSSRETEFRDFMHNLSAEPTTYLKENKLMQHCTHASGSLHRQSILVALLCLLAARVNIARKHKSVRKSSMGHFFRFIAFSVASNRYSKSITTTTTM